MTYALDVALEARSAWLALEVNVQEAVLDELDRLAASPFSLPRGAAVRDVVIETGGVRHYVFIQVSVSHSKQVVSVYRIGHFTRAGG